MKVQMAHALAAILSHIGHNPPAAVGFVRLHDFRNHRENVRYDCVVLGGDAVRAVYVLLRDHQNMHRRLRLQIIKGNAEIIFIRLF